MLREIEEMHSRKTSLLVSAEKAEQIKFPVLTGGAKTYPTVANLVETKSLNLHYESMLELLAKKIVAKNHSGIEKFLFQEDAKLRGNDSVNLKLIAQTHRIQNDFNRSKIVNKSKEKWISRMKPYEPRHSGAFYETPGKLESILRFKADFKEQIPRFIDSAESDLLRPQSFTPNFFASKSVAVENTGFLQLPIYHA